MMGLVYKDFKLSKKNLTYYFFFFLLYAGMAMAGIFPLSVMSGLVVVIGMSTPLTTFSWDNVSKWDSFVCALPGGRRAVVGGKYLFTALCVLGMGAAAAVMVLALHLTGLAEETLDTLFAIPVCAAISLGINAVSLPLVFKFGVEKSRIFTMLTLAVAAAGGVMLAGVATTNLSELSDAVVAAGFGVVSAVCVAGFIASYFISRRIYGCKEF